VNTGDPAAGAYSNRRVAHGSAATLRQLEQEGRLEGYQADFVRQTNPQDAVGPLAIASAATVFRTVAGARAGFRQAVRAAAVPGATALSTGPLGDQAAGFMSERQAQGLTFAEFVVQWRQRNVVNAIVIEGNALGMDLGYAMRLARLQEGRER